MKLKTSTAPGIDEEAWREGFRRKVRNLPRGILRDSFRRAEREYNTLKAKHDADCAAVPFSALVHPMRVLSILRVEMENRRMIPSRGVALLP